MILIAIQNYFLKVRKASLNHLAVKFSLNEEMLQDMLNLWIKKGKLKKTILESGGCVTGCSTCPLNCFSEKTHINSTTIYEWIT